jgi:hypothetical protein
MKRSILFIALGLLTGSLMAAPKDDVAGAVKKLGDAGNYSWKTTTQAPGGAGGGGGKGRGGFGGGPSEGKTSKDGYTIISRTFGENTFDTVIKGEKSVSKGQDGGWQTPAELAAARGGDGGGKGKGRGGFGAGAAGLNRAPVAQAEDLLGKVKELKSADGAYSGDLTEEGAKSLLTFGGGRAGGNGPEISGAKGSVKFWIKDGVLSKYEVKVQGAMSFNGNDINIDRTTTTEIKDVGTTKVEVPEEAKKKVS